MPELVPMSSIVNTIEQALRIGFRNFAFLGGEPTIRENIEELFTAFRSPSDSNVLIITNGIVFNENLVKSAFASQAKSVYIVQSFDSFETPNYKKQNPTKILENISKIEELAKDYNGQNRGVCIHGVISRENYKKIYQLVDFFYAKKIDISLGLVCPSRFDSAPNPTAYNHFNFEELDIILKQFERLKLDNKLNFANSVLYEYLQLFPYNKVNIKADCKAGREHIIVNPDGEVYPCITQSYAKTMKYGNIKDTPFELIYKKLQKFICSEDFAPACYDHYLWNKLN